jgi:hypothetical protein
MHEGGNSVGSIVRTVDLEASATDVWDAVCDFGALHDRLVPGFVVDAQLDGRRRRITFVSGAVATEELVSVDDERHRLVYRVVESGLGFDHYQAAVEVAEREDASSRITWTIDLLPDDRLEIVAGLMDLGEAAMMRAFSQ